MIFHHTIQKISGLIAIGHSGSSFQLINLNKIFTTDLVLARELIGNESAMRHKEDLGRVFIRRNVDSLFGSIAARAALPYPPVAIALSYNLLSVKTIQSRAKAENSAPRFTKSGMSKG